MASKTNLLTIMTLFKEKISVLFFLTDLSYREFIQILYVWMKWRMGHVHVIFKDSLISTYDEITRRFHARTLICGTPSIISTTGIIEAPAKPRDYYFKMMLSDLLNLSNEEIKTKFNGRFIDYGDPSVFCAPLGFAVQAVFYFLTDGDPFCIKNTCTLYNSHWQEEMIRAQVKTPKFCEYHETLLSFNYQN